MAKHPAATDVEVGATPNLLSIPELAERLRCEPRTLARWLETLNERHGGTLLVNVSRGRRRPRWKVSLEEVEAIYSAERRLAEARIAKLDELRTASWSTYAVPSASARKK